MFNKKITVEEHSDKLIEMYEQGLDNSSGKPFIKSVLTEAIRKLYVGVAPKKVENWVVKLERSWMSLTV